METPSKRELQKITSNHSNRSFKSYDIDFKDFMKLYKDYAKQPCLF